MAVLYSNPWNDELCYDGTALYFDSIKKTHRVVQSDMINTPINCICI